MNIDVISIIDFTVHLQVLDIVFFICSSSFLRRVLTTTSPSQFMLNQRSWYKLMLLKMSIPLIFVKNANR